MRLSSYLAILLISFSVGCSNRALPGPAGSASEASPTQLSNRIFAVSYPLQFLTQQIAGEEIEVLLPFDKSDDPRKSRPARETIKAMQDSDLVIANGVGARYAKWLALVSLSDSKIVNTASRGLALKEYIQVKGESVVHSHGPEGEHSHPVMAARAWLDPSLAKKQASYIAKQLKETYPARADQFDQNLDGLHARLDELDATMAPVRELVKVKSRIALTAGSQFEFFARFAGFSTEPLRGFSKGDGDLPEDQLLAAVKAQLQTKPKVPGGASSGSASNSADSEKPKLVFVDERMQVPEDLLALLSSLGIHPVRIDVLDYRPANGDYISTMKMNIDRAVEAFERSEAASE